MSLATLSLFPTGLLLAQATQDQTKGAAPAAAPATAVPVAVAQAPASAPGATQGGPVSDASGKARVQGNGKAGATNPAGGKQMSGQAMPGGPQGMPGMPTPQPPAYTQFKLNPKTNMFLDFTDSNPDMIISIFARTSGITILKDPSFKTLLTVTSAKSVPLKEAFEIFDTVLGLNGYTLVKQGNLMIVSRKNPPPMQIIQQAPPPPPQAPVVKTYPILHADADRIAKVINEVLGGGSAPAGGGNNGFPPGVIINGIPGGQPGGAPGGRSTAVKATSEEHSNSVIVTAMPKDQTEVEALIKSLDIVSSTPLESNVFQLKFVPIDQVLSAVEDVLTANTPNGRGAGKSNNQNQGYFFDYYGFGGGGGNKHTAGGQSATAIKQTNSIIINATPDNMRLIEKLIESLDKPAEFAGTSFTIKLKNAKASDVADLLNKVLTQRQNPNDNNGFFIFSDFMGSSNRNNKSLTTDIDENGRIVNVRDIIGKVNIVADPNTNSLLIVTQPSNMKPIRDMVDKIDQVAEQVMIETIIVEASLDKQTKLGVEYTMLPSKIFGGKGTSGSGNVGFGLNTTPAGEGVNYTISSGQYKSFINAIQTDTKFKVLDTPRIFTSNNVKAEINVSQKIPYITTQTTNSLGNVVSNYTFQDVGVVLTVTPRITSNGNVTMDVVQSADDLKGFTDFNAPIINHRQASTTVSVADGATIVLGGIIRHTLTQTDKKVPFFGDLPLIGNFFKASDKTLGQTELMVFLTPHVIHSAAEAERIRKEQAEQLSKQSQGDVKNIIKGGG